MASKTFEIRTEPHTAVIGALKLLFQPEVPGALFASAYSGLKEAQRAITDAGDNVGAAELTAVNEGMRAFIESFLVPESVTAFDAAVLPDRVLVQLLEWTSELYGGNQGNDRGGQSTGS